MKKVLLLTFFALYGIGQIIAQEMTVSGKITDSTNGTPLAGVTVRLEGKTVGATSDADGMYTIKLDVGDVLVFTYTGYKEYKFPVQLKDVITINMEMLPDGIALEQIVVVGSRRANRIKTETPVPVDVINVGANTVTTARADVTSMLNYAAPSFNYNKQSGSDGADHIDLATLRGLGPDQTLVLINGKRRHQTAFVSVFGTRGRGNSGTDLNAIPAAAIDRVEILRDGASAQYGSDAIAGVINIILKENLNKSSLDLGISGYYDPKYNPAFITSGDKDVYGDSHEGQYEVGDSKKFDGMAYTAAFNTGMPFGNKGGVFNLTLNYARQDKTYRQEFGGKLPLSIYRRANGEGSLDAYGAFFNAESPLCNDGKLDFYSFGGINYKESDAFAFTRNFSARPERFPTTAAGDLIPVEGIIKQTPGGENFFNPHIQTKIKDVSWAGGFKGAFENGWQWDFSHNVGYNNFHFYGDKTFNAGLGAGVTHFDDGGFSFLQNTTNLNLNREYANILSGFGLAFGAEYRAENYELFAGQQGSYANYNEDKATGAQGFPGYQPSDEVDATRNCVGVYADAELDVTEKFLLGAAVRYEDYSDFGNTLNWKAAARYKLMKNFNLRASYSTGFRAPSLQQINFSSTFTTVQGGMISEVKIAPNTSRITQSAGIEPLKQEESTNASIGFSWKPMPELSFTVDAYQVQVKDRVVLSGQFSADDTSLDPAFTNTLNNLGVSLAQFFVNAVNTTNQGVDFVLDYNRKMSADRSVHCLLTANLQNMTIDKINVPAKLGTNQQAFLSDREQTFILASAPNAKAALSLDYGWKKFTFGARLNYFGEVTLLGYGEDGLGINPTVPNDDGSGSVPDEYVYGGKLVPDIFVGWKICKSATLHVGVDNFLNVHPDLGYVKTAPGWAFNNETGGPWDAVQMGGNGLRAFTRLSMNF
ncbi:MAG: TonB-dependent receptor [Saprospiraceae bacterium]|nr:TonB-dependent receptor [Saprospiraceae bacterium]